MKTLILIAALAAVAAVAGGCATEANTENDFLTGKPAATAAPPRTAPVTAAPGVRPAQGPVDSAKRFVMAPELQGLLHVVSVRSWRDAGRLMVQMNVKNQTQAPVKFNYRVEWFDADGTKLPLVSEGPAAWMLMGNEMSSIVVTAPTSVATDFEIGLVPAVN